jgi:acyl carrier protein
LLEVKVKFNNIVHSRYKETIGRVDLRRCFDIHSRAWVLLSKTINDPWGKPIDIHSFLGYLIENRLYLGELGTMIRKIQSIFAKVKNGKIRKNEAAVNLAEMSSVAQRIKATMAGVFKIDITEINEETSADNIDQWSSLEHVDFILNLQKEFDIEFSDSQIVEMLSYKTVVQNVYAAINGKN